MPRADLGHRDAQVQPHALAAEDLRGVVVRAVGERAEQRVAEVDEVDLRRADRQVVVLGRHRLGDQVRERPRQLDAGRAAADDDERERALVEQRGVAVGRLEDLEDPRAQPRRVVERVERERVLLRAGVRKKFGREPAASTSASPAKRSPPASVTERAAGSSSVTSPSLTSTFSCSRNSLRSEKAMSLEAELRGRHLVEQRLELVVVVAVDQRDRARRPRARAA